MSNLLLALCPKKKEEREEGKNQEKEGECCFLLEGSEGVGAIQNYHDCYSELLVLSLDSNLISEGWFLQSLKMKRELHYKLVKSKAFNTESQ